MNTEHETAEDYYTRGLVAGHRRIFFLSESAARQSLTTAEDMVLFYGEMNMDRMEAYYAGIRDILGDYFEAVEEQRMSELENAEDLGIQWWERILYRIPPAVIGAVGIAVLLAIFYWRGPEF